MILASGGIRSLVATAVIASSSEKSKITLLHLKDARPNAPRRLEHIRRQAEYFQIHSLIELELPHLQSEEFTHESQGPQPAVLARPQMILVAMAQAIELGASRLVWPAQVHGEYDTIACITEQTVLIQHLTQLEQPSPPVIEMPLLELTDPQMIQLGGQLDVPWHLAWTCTLRGDVPCRICEACRRRRAAFDAAGMVDTIDKPAAMRSV